MKIKLSLFLILLLSNCILNATLNEFTITEFKRFVTPCHIEDNTYEFLLVGTFSEEIVTTNMITLDLKSPEGKATCVPVSMTEGFKCYIDISKYPLVEKIEIIPEVQQDPDNEVYTFPNFEEFLKGKTLEAICNDFDTNKVEDKGCTDSKKNNIKISGKWNVNNVYPFTDAKFELQLSNEKKAKASCDFKKDTPAEFECLFEGGGKVKFEDNIIKFNEKYFYKFNKHESDVEAKDCSKKSSSNFIGLTFGIILLNILLF